MQTPAADRPPPRANGDETPCSAAVAETRLLSRLSHELRGRLYNILGFAELLHDGRLGPVSDAHREYLGDILSSAREAVQLADDLADIARVDVGTLELHPDLVDLGRLAVELRAAVHENASPRRIRVDAATPPPMAGVVLDAARFRQLALRLLLRAVRRTPEGGRVAMRLAPEPPDRFRFEVEEGGVPARSEDRGNTADRLDLDVTQRLAQALGGCVETRPAPERGTILAVVLPCCAPAPRAPEDARGR